MTQQIFAYISHKNGAADDSAFELIVAAKKIDPAAAVTAIVCGAGAELDAVCTAMAGVYPEVWKVANPALAYPNAEILRGVLVNILPAGAITLVPHDTFGMDLSPGLSIKLNAAFVPDVVGIEGIDGANLKAIRQEFGGQVSTHVHCDISAGAVLNVRSGCFLSDDSKASGSVTDKSGQAGDCKAKRRFLELVAAEVGDVEFTKSDVLVSVGRGIEDQENIGIAQELADAIGAVVSCSDRSWTPSGWKKPGRWEHPARPSNPRFILRSGSAALFSIWAASRAIPSWWPSTRTPKPLFFKSPTSALSRIFWSLCPS